MLDPESKLSHFKKHWSVELQEEIIKSAEDIVSLQLSVVFKAMHINVSIQFQKHYIELYGYGVPTKPMWSKANKRLAKLMEALSESSNKEGTLTPSVTPATTPGINSVSAKPWLQEFNVYLHSAEESVGEMTLPNWWGVSQFLVVYHFDSKKANPKMHIR